VDVESGCRRLRLVDDRRRYRRRTPASGYGLRAFATNVNPAIGGFNSKTGIGGLWSSRLAQRASRAARRQAMASTAYLRAGTACLARASNYYGVFGTFELELRRVGFQFEQYRRLRDVVRKCRRCLWVLAPPETASRETPGIYGDAVHAVNGGSGLRSRRLRRPATPSTLPTRRQRNSSVVFGVYAANSNGDGGLITEVTSD